MYLYVHCPDLVYNCLLTLLPSLQLDGEHLEGRGWPFPVSCLPHSVSVAQGLALSSGAETVLVHWFYPSLLPPLPPPPASSFPPCPPPFLTFLFTLLVLYSSLCWRRGAVLTGQGQGA